MLELLAPAGDIQSFDTAISCGADAVYLGLSNFNARMKADNFDQDNIYDVVRKAHFYGVKVYVTINTILQNQELNDMLSLVKVAIDAKVDAFLVQDLGVAKLLRDCFDGIVLHASTQMGVHNLYGAKVAQKMGIKRVVLSRETKLDDIKAIKQNTNLEIEYFVQGALCICFSGNCYLSSCEQNASGNRGLCKQLCRLPYTAQLGQKRVNGYLLSARDLCLAEDIVQLANAGVSSFKIEGRMRRPEYVGQAVLTYRQAIDSAKKALDANDVKLPLSKQEMLNLKIAYSRGEYLKRAYLDSGTPKVVESRFANHQGVRIGKVLSVKPFKQDLFEVKINSNRELKNGDGLKFFENGKEIASLGVGDVKNNGNGNYTFITKTKVNVNQDVNIISSSELSAKIKQVVRTQKIDVVVNALCGQPLEIVATHATNDGKHIVVKKVSDMPLERAQKAPMNADDIKNQVCKVGDSGFEVCSIAVNTDNVFIAKSVLNNLRREVLDDLKEQIILHNTPSEIVVNQGKINQAKFILESLYDKSANTKIKVIASEDALKTGIVAKDEKVALSLSNYTALEYQKALKLLNLDGSQVALKLPIIANGKDLKIIEKLIDECNINTVISENIYGLHFVSKGVKVIAGQGHNVANIFAMLQAQELGASEIVKSLEYPNALANDDVHLASIDKNLPLMTFAHCPYKTLNDNDCSKCTYQQGLVLNNNRTNYAIRRYVVSQCYFEMYKQ